MAAPYLIQPIPSLYAMQSTLQSRNHLLQRLNSLPTTMSSSSQRIIHLPPLSSKTTAQLLRKPSEPPYPQPLASEKMKSGTSTIFTASLPPPHSTHTLYPPHLKTPEWTKALPPQSRLSDLHTMKPLTTKRNSHFNT